MTEEGVAHFLLSLSLFPLFRLFLSFRRAYIYIYIYRSVLPSLVSSLFTCRFTKCSHFKQYPGYSCTLVRRRRTRTPRTNAREHRPTVPPPLPSFPTTPLAPPPSKLRSSATAYAHLLVSTAHPFTEVFH